MPGGKTTRVFLRRAWWKDNQGLLYKSLAERQPGSSLEEPGGKTTSVFFRRAWRKDSQGLL